MQSQIAVAQMDCTLGDVKANLAKIAAMTADAKKQGANLVIFPELATTGYFISDRIAELGEPIPGPTTKALTNIAKQHEIWLITGMAEAAEGKYFNTSVLISPDGPVGAYRKVHLFDAVEFPRFDGQIPA